MYICSRHRPPKSHLTRENLSPIVYYLVTTSSVKVVTTHCININLKKREQEEEEENEHFLIIIVN